VTDEDHGAGPRRDHLVQLDQQMAQLLAHHHDAVQHLAEVPGLGVDSARQIIAEVGASAAAFPSAKQLARTKGIRCECASDWHVGHRRSQRILQKPENSAHTE